MRKVDGYAAPNFMEKNMTTSGFCSSVSGKERAFIIFVKKNA